MKNAIRWLLFRLRHRRGCDGKPIVHSGLCRCECEQRYLGL